MRFQEVVLYVRRPRALAHRLWRAWWQRRHPDAPWLAPGAIAFLDAHLPRDGTGLEWGSGRSTVWLAQRLTSLTSVEHHAGWFETVRAMPGASGVDLRLVPLPDDRAEQAKLYWTGHDYVRVADGFADASLDFVLIDGAFRQECVAHVLTKVRGGGLLAIDNARAVPALEDWGVPAAWPVVFVDPRPYLDTVIWQRPVAD